MDTLLNLLRATGYIGGLIAVFIIIARVWSGTNREQLIKYLQSELEAARAHTDESDKTVQHYRQEMHDVRDTCDAEMKKGQNQVEELKELLTAAKLENVKLSSRPDLSTIEDLVRGQNKMINAHIECDKKVFASLEKSLKGVVKHLQRMNK